MIRGISLTGLAGLLLLYSCQDYPLRSLPNRDYPNEHKICEAYVNSIVPNTVVPRSAGEVLPDVFAECERLMAEVLKHYGDCIGRETGRNVKKCEFVNPETEQPIYTPDTTINCFDSAGKMRASNLDSKVFDLTERMQIACDVE